MKIRSLKKRFKRFLKRSGFRVKNGEVRVEKHMYPSCRSIAKRRYLTWEDLIEPNYESFCGPEDYLVERYEYWSVCPDIVDINMVNVWTDKDFHVNENHCGGTTVSIKTGKVIKRPYPWQ